MSQEARQWWESIFFERDRRISQDMVSDAIWYALINIARSRFRRGQKFSRKNVNPRRADFLIYGELLGVQRLVHDLYMMGVIAGNVDHRKAINSLVEEHLARCQASYGEFP